MDPSSDLGRPDRLMPLAEARRIVGLSRSKLYELLADHTFPPPVKIGRNNYFSEREIQAWITSRLTNRSGGRSDV